jgi:hypothetical protein
MCSPEIFIDVFFFHVEVKFECVQAFESVCCLVDMEFGRKLKWHVNAVNVCDYNPRIYVDTQ